MSLTNAVALTACRSNP